MKDPKIIFKESRVPTYILPDPLKDMEDNLVSNEEVWWNKRRAEIFELFNENIYGKMPGRPEKMAFEVTKSKKKALNGKATMKEVVITIENNNKPIKLNLLIYIPNTNQKPYSTFLGLNFYGNHTVHPDPDIALTDLWIPIDKNYGITENKATESTRGVRAERWSVEHVIDNGYAIATLYNGDLDPDYDDGFKNGVHPLFYKEGQTKPAINEWGTIGAWAWGLSRIMDYFEYDNDIDSRKVIIFGHSRLAKVALWAGANDPRFAIVISNNSGSGGAALFRRKFGETIYYLNKTFPHWFCQNFKKYDEKEDELPVDQHMLISLIAPRPVYIASAQDDFWSDPKGEFLSAKLADPVYKLLGTDGLKATKMPEINHPIFSRIGYHIRSGDHDLNRYDLDRFIEFANSYLT